MTSPSEASTAVAAFVARLPQRLLLYDGTCALCDATAHFVFARTKKAPAARIVMMCPQQSDAVASLYTLFPQLKEHDTIYFVSCTPTAPAADATVWSRLVKFAHGTPDFSAQVADADGKRYDVDVRLRSNAALHVALCFDWLAARAAAVVLLLLVPRLLADAVYKYVAAHRYQWFGKITGEKATASCQRPPPGLRIRAWPPKS